MNYIINRSKFIKIIVISVGLLLIIFLIYLIRRIILEALSPVFFAVIITYLFNPMVNKFQKRMTSRFAAISLVYLFVIIGICILFSYLIPELIRSFKDMANKLPKYVEYFQVYFYELIIRYNHIDLPPSIRTTIEDNIYEVQDYITNSIQLLMGSAVGIIDFLFDFIIGAVLAFYILKDIKTFEKTAISIIPRKARDWTLDLLRDIDMVLAGFIHGQIFIAIILSVLTSIGLKIIGIKHFLLLGIIAGFGEIIPYFGPIMGIIPSIIAAFILNPLSALWVFLLYFIIQQFEAAVLSPKIMGSKVGLHPVTVIMSVFIGGKFFGLIGLIFAVPIVGILRVLSKRIIQSIVSE